MFILKERKKVLETVETLLEKKKNDIDKTISKKIESIQYNESASGMWGQPPIIPIIEEHVSEILYQNITAVLIEIYNIQNELNIKFRKDELTQIDKMFQCLFQGFIDKFSNNTMKNLMDTSYGHHDFFRGCSERILEKIEPQLLNELNLFKMKTKIKKDTLQVKYQKKAFIISFISLLISLTALLKSFLF